ncbi:hypothetical protein EAE72_25775 [Salmonella enterica subsp. enterica serovar Typhimurium]|nr:hypothetical protein [Salmonella enterica]EAS4701657.1 hypothetical protein [Salmonella enterica subsp. enterica serovar Typhimurium var. 5-]EBB4561234.1 hypothetical protein [Salmonella enterica subsp. enterica serovar Typhimurium]EAM2918234.1 hypothetical protein [Salmonella enterica]EAS4705028.1 hypothetical protein [Salmonella enterica subsp. enterica serovar Typhimurium var. 5-]
MINAIRPIPSAALARLSAITLINGQRYCRQTRIRPRFYVSTSKSIIKALINMHSFEIQLSPIG